MPIKEDDLISDLEVSQFRTLIEEIVRKVFIEELTADIPMMKEEGDGLGGKIQKEVIERKYLPAFLVLYFQQLEARMQGLQVAAEQSRNRSGDSIRIMKEFIEVIQPPLVTIGNKVAETEDMKGKLQRAVIKFTELADEMHKSINTLQIERKQDGDAEDQS